MDPRHSRLWRLGLARVRAKSYVGPFEPSLQPVRGGGRFRPRSLINLRGRRNRLASCGPRRLDDTAGLISSVLFWCPGSVYGRRCWTRCGSRRLLLSLDLDRRDDFPIRNLWPQRGYRPREREYQPTTSDQRFIQRPIACPGACKFRRSFWLRGSFNSSARTILVVGSIAAGANALRLMLHDSVRCSLRQPIWVR